MAWDAAGTREVMRGQREQVGTGAERSGGEPRGLTASQAPPADDSRQPENENVRQMAEWVTIIQRVWSCGRQLRRWLSEQLAPWELTDSEFLLLFSCSQACGEGLAQQDLGGALGISPARVSNHVERLSRRELIQVTRPVRDRRRQTLRLTPAGVQLVDVVLARLAPQAASLERSAAAEQRQAALRWLDGCRQAAG